MRTGGIVALRGIITKVGTVEDIEVLGGPVTLQQAAVDAVKKWQYAPYLLDGKPVEVETEINVVFNVPTR